MRLGFRRPVGRFGRSAATSLAVLLAASIPSPSLAAPASSLPVPTPLERLGAVGSTPTRPVGPPERRTQPADAAAGLEPSIQYEEALAHDHDRIAFTSGARVTVGFTPRPGDGWQVGGETPRSLPAGRLDGAAIRGQGSRGTDTTPPGEPASGDATVDLPTETGPATLASGASFEAPQSPSAGTVGVEAAISRNGLRREIFGFLPYWEVNSSSLRLDYRKISTIAYFGVGADAAGSLQKRNADGSTTVGWSGWTSSRMTSIITAAHTNRTRVVLTVQSFGWNTSGLNRQKSLLGSSTARLRLARQIAAAVRDRGADGVNLDFEPLASGYDAQFTALVRSIRTELNRIHAGYQITFDTTGSIGNYPIEEATAPGGADAIFIMGYDYRGSSSSPVGSVAPFEKDGYDITDTVRAYAARVPPSKLILGVPYYGRAWSTTGNALNAPNISGPKYGASTTVTYDTAADYLGRYGRRYDPLEEVAWTAYKRQNCTATYGCVTAWREIYVDDAAALGRKYDLVNAYGLRGAGIWALGYDGTRPELYAAIQRKFITDTTAPTVGITMLPTREVNPEFWVSWTGTDDVGIASYDVQRAIDGGPWATWLSGTTRARAAWDGEDGHGYAFRVRARDRRGNLSPWNVTVTTVGAIPLTPGAFAVSRVDGLAVRSAPDTTATKVGSLSSGDVVAIVGGPRSADGYTWFQVTGPLTEWRPLRTTFSARWVAASSATTTHLSATKPPNATSVRAMLGHLAFGGAGAASIGTSAAAVGARSFSPNGDRSRDGLALAWTNGVDLDTLSLRVFRADGTLLGQVPLSALAAGDRTATWNGSVGSTRLPNGRYVVSLVGTAGSARYYNPIYTWRSYAPALYGVTIDTIAPTVTSAAVTGSLISPNGDGILDSVRASIAGSGATGWAFGVAPLSGSTVGSPILVRSGSGGAISLTWGGRDAGGRLVPDGRYRLALVLLDAAGNRTQRAWTVRVDRTPATLGATAPAWFSPNGDGAFDTARLAWSASEPIAGTLRVYRGSTVIRSWAISRATSGAVSWNGTTATGTRVGDGTYSVRVSGRDAAGNPAAIVRSVVVDRTLSTLRWAPSPFFPQDGDALAARSVMSVRLARNAVVSAGIYSGSTLVRTIWSKAALSAGGHSWRWDGRNAGGAFVARGVYIVRVTATTALGTTSLSRGVLADAFTVSLTSTSLRAGQTLTVTLATVEPLRSVPTVTFTQPGRAAIRKTATSLGGGRYRVAFVVASGPAGIASIGITGRDTSGGLNTSTRTVAIH